MILAPTTVYIDLQCLTPSEVSNQMKFGKEFLLIQVINSIICNIKSVYTGQSEAYMQPLHEKGHGKELYAVIGWTAISYIYPGFKNFFVYLSSRSGSSDCFFSPISPALIRVCFINTCHRIIYFVRYFVHLIWIYLY